tara:strand:- start:263 stop:739 length:477 start_codon:yes stop_codon:yes gene_type:complete
MKTFYIKLTKIVIVIFLIIIIGIIVNKNLNKIYEGNEDDTKIKEMTDELTDKMIRYSATIKDKIGKVIKSQSLDAMKNTNMLIEEVEQNEKKIANSIGEYPNVDNYKNLMDNIQSIVDNLDLQNDSYKGTINDLTKIQSESIRDLLSSKKILFSEHDM